MAGGSLSKEVPCDAKGVTGLEGMVGVSGWLECGPETNKSPGPLSKEKEEPSLLGSSLGFIKGQRSTWGNAFP